MLHSVTVLSFLSYSCSCSLLLTPPPPCDLHLLLPALFILIDGTLNAVTDNEAKKPGITCNSLPPYTADINAQFVLIYCTDVASCPRHVIFPNYLPEILILLLCKWNYKPKHPFPTYRKFYKQCNRDAISWTDLTA